MASKIFSVLCLFLLIPHSHASILDIEALSVNLSTINSSSESFDGVFFNRFANSPGAQDISLLSLPFSDRFEISDEFVSGSSDLTLSETNSSFQLNLLSQHTVSNFNSDTQELNIPSSSISNRLSFGFTPKVDSVLSLSGGIDFQTPVSNEGMHGSSIAFSFTNFLSPDDPVSFSSDISIDNSGIVSLDDNLFTANLEAGTNYFLTLDASTLNFGAVFGFFDVGQLEFVDFPPSTVIANSNFSLEITAVPLPAASWLLLSGLLGLVRFKKKV